METTTGTADARKLLDKIIESLPAHRRADIDEEITYSGLSDRLHHLKIVIRIEAGCEDRDVWPTRNRILDMHRLGHTEWPEKLKVQVDMNARKKPYVTEMGEVLKLLVKMGVTEQIKVGGMGTALLDCEGSQQW